MQAFESKGRAVCCPTLGGSSSSSIATKYTLWRQRLKHCNHKQQIKSQQDAIHYRQQQTRHHKKPNISTAAAAAATSDLSATTHSSSNQQQQRSDVPAVGDTLDNVICERLGTAGVGVCTAPPSKFILLIKGALPGEKLVANITSVKKGYAEGVKLHTLSPHTDAAVPHCQHFGTCGGCNLQTLTYDAQLNHKVNHVAQLFSRVSKLSPDVVAATRMPAIAAAAGQQYMYRNKIQLAFSSKVWQSASSSSSSSSKDQSDQIYADRDDDQLMMDDQLGFAGQVADGWGLGFYLPGSNSVVMPVNECSLVGPEGNALLSGVRTICQQYNLHPYNPDTGQGQLRHLIIRSAAAPAAAAAAAEGVGSILDPGSASDAAPVAAAAVGGGGGGEDNGMHLMAVIVTTAACQSSELQPVADELMIKYNHLGLVSVIHSIEAAAAAAVAAKQPATTNGRNSRQSHQRKKTLKHSRSGKGLQKGQQETTSSSGSSSSSKFQGARALSISSSTVLAGVPHLTAQLCGLQFVISPHSFFQTNTAQAEQLCRQVVQAVQQYYQQEAAVENAGNSGVVLDLYTGTGTIALSIANSNCCKQVVGFDVSQSSIADAQANAARNIVTNVQFVRGDLNQLARGDLLGPGVHPDVAVVDPARAGLGAEVVSYLLRCGAKRLIYVSCNAATQARDLQLLCGGVGSPAAASPTSAASRVRDMPGDNLQEQSSQHDFRSMVGKVADAGRAAGARTGSSEQFVVRSWTAVDMYPQTAVEHVETVVVMDRLSSTDSCQ